MRYTCELKIDNRHSCSYYIYQVITYKLRLWFRLYRFFNDISTRSLIKSHDLNKI